MSGVRIAAKAAALIAERCKRHRTCLQAGGHQGAWANALAERFQQTYTFEPHPENFAALIRNTTGRIAAIHGALGETDGFVTMQNDTGKTGMWYTHPGGEIPVYRIDDLHLTDLDALVLDVEGDEYFVLKGAEQTIRRCKPLVWFETGIRQKVGQGTPTVISWLRNLGYGHPRPGLTRDLYMRAA